MPLTSNDLFRAIGAPLKGVYSWGAVHSNGNVILRVWQDEAEREKELGQYRYRLTCYGKWDNTNRFQYKEREEHINLIRAGTPGFMIIHISDAPKEKCGFRSIKDCDSRIWEIDRIMEVEDEETGKNFWGLAKKEWIKVPTDYSTLWT
jgi:hypothetical protein